MSAILIVFSVGSDTLLKLYRNAYIPGPALAAAPVNKIEDG